MNSSLNLLPPTAKRVVRLEELYDRWRGGLLTLSVVLALLAGGLSAERWLLAAHDEDLQAELQHQQAIINQKGALDITRATLEVNNKITLLSSALPVSRHWSATIGPILAELPAGIVVDTLEISSAGKVTLKGVAQTRASFLALQAAMATSSALDQPTTTDTASKRENLPFTYVANLPVKP